MSEHELPNADRDPRAPLQAGDEGETIEQHGGSDTGTGSQQDEGIPPRQ